MHVWCTLWPMDKPDPLADAISAAGGAAKLAKAVGVVPSAISNWRRRNIVPADKALLIEAKFGISARALAHHIFPAQAAP